MADDDNKGGRGSGVRRPGKKPFRGDRPGGGANRPRQERGGQGGGQRDGRDRPSSATGERGARPLRKFGDRFRKDFRPRGERDFKGRGEAPRDASPRVVRSARDASPRPVHQRELTRVVGHSAVKALFANAPERVERLFFSPEMREETVGYRRVLAKSRKVFRETPADELARIAGTAMHGGIVAVARPMPLRAFDPAEAKRWAATSPLLVLLHGVGNPHNLGAIARTAAFLGLPRLVLTGHPAQAGLSDAAYRIAEGGFEALDVFRAENIGETLRQLKASYRVLGAAVGRGLSPERIPRDRPIALVLGNEEGGLDAATLAACDEAVTIPGAGGRAVQSLNVSVAAGVLLYALSCAPRAQDRVSCASHATQDRVMPPAGRR